MANMSVDSLRNNLTNPQRVYMWEIIFPSIPGGGDGDSATVRAQSAAMPSRSVGEITVPFKQTAGVKYPGKLSYPHTWTVTFAEGEDKAIHDAMYAWKQKIVNDYSGVGDGDESIKADLYLNLLSTKGEITRTVRLIGCYPQELGEVGLDQGEEGNLVYSVTFSYDRWEDA
jgi:hypothetical protein